VLEHLIGVHHIRAPIARRDRRRPRVHDVEAFTRELVGEHAAGFDAAISPTCGNCRSREAAVTRADLEHVAGRPRVLHDEAKAGLFNPLAPRRTRTSQFSLGKPSIKCRAFSMDQIQGARSIARTATTASRVDRNRPFPLAFPVSGYS
jgi:hypothetical protein